MDYMEKITDLRARKKDLKDQAAKLVEEDKLDDATALADQMEAINKQIAGLEALAKASREGADPVYDGVLHDGEGKPRDGGKDAPKPFATLGEQLKAISDFRRSHVEDKRLQQVNNAALGANEGTGADGGFLIQTDFAGQILESAVQQSPLLNRLDRQTCSSAANAMRWLSVDETDVSKSVFGGVQMYWASEAGTVAASRPQFREMKMDLEKMMGFAYATDEMLTDAAFMTGFFGSAFTLAADRLLTESVISGDGVGKPLGLLHSKALLAVDKVMLTFEDSAIEAIANAAFTANETAEDIGARRLHAVFEQVLEDISFNAGDENMPPFELTINGEYVQQHLSGENKPTDLRKYIL